MRGRERTAAAGGAHGEAVGDGAVGAWDARRGWEAAAETSARGSDSALKAREWRWCVAATLRWHADGRPGAESGG
jgi:hypothetical protein